MHPRPRPDVPCCSRLPWPLRSSPPPVARRPRPPARAPRPPPRARTWRWSATPRPRRPYAQLIPAFQQTPAGKGVAIDSSFGASGTQTQAVINGLDADLVALSLESDINKLVTAGLVASDWNQDQYHGMVTDSDRRAGGAQRQPEAHPDLGRPAAAGHRRRHAGRVPVGRREVEPAGGVRRPGQLGRQRPTPRGRT